MVPKLPKISYMLAAGTLIPTMISLLALRIEQHIEIWVVDYVHTVKQWPKAISAASGSVVSLVIDSVVLMAGLQLFYKIIETTQWMDPTPYSYIPIVFGWAWLGTKLIMGLFNIFVFSSILPQLLKK